MKFKLIIEPHSKSVYLEPENPGEEQLLTALVGGWQQPYDSYQVDGEEAGRSREATVTPTWSRDGQASYKRCIVLKVQL